MIRRISPICFFLAVLILGALSTADDSIPELSEPIAAENETLLPEEANPETPASDEKSAEKADAEEDASATEDENEDAEDEESEVAEEEGEEKVEADADRKTTEKAKECPAEKPATHTVKKEPFRVAIELDGVFSAGKSYEILVKPEEWNSLIVLKAAPHGARVDKGEVILALDTEKIDQAIADLEADQKLSAISVQQMEGQLQALEKTTPLDLESSRRDARIAAEDKKVFLETERPLAVKIADFSLKMAQDQLDYEEEELRQLEKMYKADEITEETEEIVLRRARDTVERAKFYAEYAKTYHDLTLKYSLPRAEESVLESENRRSLALQKTEVELPLNLEKVRLELAKQKIQRERNEEKLKKLKSDRAMMTVKSPVDGVVYYGKCVCGKFSDSKNLADSLRPYGSIMPNQVVMTVVKPRPLSILATVPEKMLHDLKPGLRGVAIPNGFPDLKLKAEIDEIGNVPVSPGNFEARVSVSLKHKSKRIMPGMGCTVKLSPYVKKEALVVPSKVVQTDKLDDEKRYVYLLDKDGKPAKRDVKLGREADKRYEILEGLAEGDKVLLEAPKDSE